MIINPERIDQKNPEWIKTLALLKVLPLDPRRKTFGTPTVSHEPYHQCADDLLVRPSITADRRTVLAPYFRYSIEFSATVIVQGTIPIDSNDELTEFRRAINEALASELTQAELARCQAYAARNLLPSEYFSRGPTEHGKYRLIEQQQNAIAFRFYTQVRQTIERCGGFKNCRCQFEKTLDALIMQGMSMLNSLSPLETKKDCTIQ